MMRRELQYQLFDNKYSSLFTKQRGKLSVDIKDLDEFEEEDAKEDMRIKEKKDSHIDDDTEFICNWGDLQHFISSTGTYLYNGKFNIKQILQFHFQSLDLNQPITPHVNFGFLGMFKVKLAFPI